MDRGGILMNKAGKAGGGGRRRKARERALQILFQMEFNPAEKEPLLAAYWRRQKATPETRAYAGWLVETFLAHRDEVDRRIQRASRNWRLERMSVVDRNVLRVATVEMLYEPSLVPPIVIDEAIEVARRYSGQEAATFVNGVLDAVRKSLSEERSSAEGEHEQEGERPPDGGPGGAAGGDAEAGGSGPGGAEAPDDDGDDDDGPGAG